MPLAEPFDRLIDLPIADMKNVGPREGGSITAAQFIQRFVDDGVRWAHLDIAGMAWSDKAGTTYDKGATGFGVRLLDQFVADMLESAEPAERCRSISTSSAGRRRSRSSPALPRNCSAQDGRLLIVAEDEALLARLDRMLWDQGATSFLPHGLAGGADDARQPILLSTSPDAPNLARNMLIADGEWREAALGYDRASIFSTMRRSKARGWRGSCCRAGKASSGATGRRTRRPLGQQGLTLAAPAPRG